LFRERIFARRAPSLLLPNQKITNSRGILGSACTKVKKTKIFLSTSEKVEYHHLY
jgi:hypothetical protein